LLIDENEFIVEKILVDRIELIYIDDKRI